MKYIEELITYQKDIDAIQIAEILWLSQFMSSESSEVEEKPKSTSDIDDTEIEEPIEEDLPSSEDEVPEPIDASTPIHEDKKQKYGFDKEQDNGSSYATNIVKKEKFPKIEKQFQSLKVKQNRISKQVLDEVKTADYIATTGYFHPIFSEIKSKESYFSLHIIIDKSESMFLWESYTNHFIKSMKFSTIFTHIHIFELDSSQKEPSVSAMNSDHSININSAIFREEKSITLVFSDITGDSWKSNRMFEVLDKWSKGSFVTIVSMLPKRMWKKTPLRQGISLFMKPKKFLPKNKDLKAEFNFTGIKTADKGINIPMLTFDSYSFSHLSNVLMSKKDSWVDSRIFRNLVRKEVAKSKKSNISPKERVANFFSFALPKTRELAIYCSVLPLNQEIIREVIEKRDLGAEKDVFSEFYFGGLIDKDVDATFGEYAFYEGVAKELRQYISVQEMEILLHQVSEVMSSSFGVDTKKINLLYESVDGSEELNDNERALVELMIEVLEDKGRFYENNVVSLEKLISKKDSTFNEKPNRKTSIVQIETSRGHGIGALINYNNEDGYATVITTKHLLYNDVGELLEATINNENTFYNIDLNKVDSVESVDLAILKISHQSSYGLLNIENEESKVGTMVSILTYNNSREYVYNGEITKTQYHSINSYAIAIKIIDFVVNISLLSGSPVIDVNTNKIIGIVSMLDTQNNVIQVIPITELLNRQLSWKPIVENEQKKPYFKKLQKFLDKEEKLGKNILPSKEHWYNSLDSTGLSDVKVVILGQDPDPTVNHAHGLAFSVLDDVKVLPKSLVNINKELFSDLNIDNSHTGYLQPWAEQGVLLLNAILTVEESKSNSHQGQGWEIFTDKVIEVINNQCHNIVFVLWGSYAQKKGKNIDESKHLILKAPSPSPLSAYRGFFNSKPFSQIDKYLDLHKIMPIEWNLNPKIISGELSAKQINYFKSVLNKRKKELQIKRNNIVHSNINISEVEIKVITEFDEVHNALEKIKDNLYGICEMCKKSINIQRLKIKPFARYCINCREDIENYPSQLTSLYSELGEDIILSREKELKEIDKLLNKNSILLINGVGGIGKTTIANYYLHSQKDNFHYYGFFRGLEKFGIDLVNSLNLKSKKEDELFMEALLKLKELKGNKLLIFDDVIKTEENREKIKKILALKNYGYKILLTSREEIEDINQYYLDALSLEDAKALFNSIYKVEDEVLLEEVLTYLDGNSFFIEKTAKVLKSKKTLTLEIIKEKFENGEFSIIKSKRKESFSDNLNQLFTFDELDNEEIIILKQLSILPSIEIEFSFLEQIFNKQNNEEFEEILNYLSEKGWLKNINNKYKLHQITKEYILSNHLPSFDEIESIVQFFYNSKAKDLKNNLFYIESINYILRQMGKKDEFYNDNISDASCGLCTTKLNDKDFFIDGEIKESGGAWGNVCLDCFEKHGIQIGKGIGQLYKKNNSKWLLLAGWEMNITDDRKVINNLRRYIQQSNKRKIGKFIQYPLKRFGFIPDIVNEEDFIKRYSQIFDEKLIDMIARASDEDWSEVGYKGTMLYDGEIWISDGKIIAINYSSEEEQILQQELQNEDKESIHISLKSYQKNKLVWLGENYRIRIDEVENLLYRCAIWKKQRKQSREPSLILQDGSVTYDGSGGNHYYTFIKSKYKYVVNINILGYDDSLGELLIYKNDELIEDEKFPQGSDESKGKLGREYRHSNLEDMILNITKETWNEFGFDNEEDINPLKMKEKEKKNLNKLREERKRKK